jgi:hypothetical protein
MATWAVLAVVPFIALIPMVALDPRTGVTWSDAPVADAVAHDSVGHDHARAVPVAGALTDAARAPTVR